MEKIKKITDKEINRYEKAFDDGYRTGKRVQAEIDIEIAEIYLCKLKLKKPK